MSMLRNLLMQKVKKEEEEPSSPFIEFADPEVKRICVDNWGGATGGSTGISGTDGEITYEQAAAVKNVGNAFLRNTTITSFDEFQYFTGVEYLYYNEGFQYCTNLVSITLPSNLTSLKGMNFLHCFSLAYINLENVTSYKRDNAGNVAPLRMNASPYNNSLKSIRLHESITSLAEYFAQDCRALEDINLEHIVSFGNSCLSGTKAFGDNFVFNENTRYYYQSGFNGNFVLPKTMETFNVSDAGYGYKGTHIIIKNGGTQNLSVVFLDFRTSGSVELVDFPSNVTSITFGSRLFYRTSGNLSFVMRATTPVGSAAFTSANSVKYIFVPSGSVDAYKAATGWSTYASKIYSIGGAEWVAVFGSANEYADYTKYGVEPPTA